jgi:tRNA-dihydrouridine synthase A
MKMPEVVVDCLNAVQKAVSVPVTVKCRLGVDDEDSYEFAHKFVETVSGGANIGHFVIHARKAFLQGLNPKENRTVPPLRYDMVFRLAKDFPHVKFSINGGIKTLKSVQELTESGCLVGCMVGRQVYEDIWHIGKVDKEVFGMDPPNLSRKEILLRYGKYCDHATKMNPGLNPLTLVKPLNSIMNGVKGASNFRQYLSHKENYTSAGSWDAYFGRLIIELEAINPETLSELPYPVQQ